MKLNLKKPIIFFDIESTGLDIATDGIVELCFVKVFPDGTDKVKTWKIKPLNYETGRQIPMNPEASEVNGIKDEDLVNCKTFITYIGEITEWLKGSDLSGFNSTRFDLPMLAEEYERVKQYCRNCISDRGKSKEDKDKAREVLKYSDIDFHKCKMVDVQTIFHYMEPRNLKAAYRFYCGGKDFEDAHTAEADTRATYEVLKGQLDMYGKQDGTREQVLKNDVDFLANIGNRPDYVDYARRIVLADNVPTINFGKYKGKTVREVYDSDKGYFSWIDGANFTLDTKEQFRKLASQFEKEDRQKDNEPPTRNQLDGLKDKFNNR